MAKTFQKKTGTVIFLNHRRGYGWIRLEQTAEDLFFHIVHMQQDQNRIEVGDQVMFEVDRNKYGLIAKDVVRISSLKKEDT